MALKVRVFVLEPVQILSQCKGKGKGKGGSVNKLLCLILCLYAYSVVFSASENKAIVLSSFHGQLQQFLRDESVNYNVNLLLDTAFWQSSQHRLDNCFAEVKNRLQSASEGEIALLQKRVFSQPNLGLLELLLFEAEQRSDYEDFFWPYREDNSCQNSIYAQNEPAILGESLAVFCFSQAHRQKGVTSRNRFLNIYDELAGLSHTLQKICTYRQIVVP